MKADPAPAADDGKDGEAEVEEDNSRLFEGRNARTHFAGTIPEASERLVAGLAEDQLSEAPATEPVGLRQFEGQNAHQKFP